MTVEEENRHLAFLAAGAGLQQKQFIHHTLIGSKANRISEKSSQGAELAAVWATAPGFDRNDAARSPAFADFLEHRTSGLWHQLRLFKIARRPWSHRPFLQRCL